MCDSKESDAQILNILVDFALNVDRDSTSTLIKQRK